MHKNDTGTKNSMKLKKKVMSLKTAYVLIRGYSFMIAVKDTKGYRNAINILFWYQQLQIKLDFFP